MAELTFFYGTMNCGKSTMALQVHHTATRAGKRCLLLTMRGRSEGAVASRIGLTRPALEVTPELDLHGLVRGRIESGDPVDEVVCDEAQFYSPAQVEQLARVVDELAVDVVAFGLLTDFTTSLFPGSKRLVELADRRREMQVETRCWCGDRATHNARVVDGEVVFEGDQVVVGDVAEGQETQLRIDEVVPGDVGYEVLCRHHHRAGEIAPPGGGS